MQYLVAAIIGALAGLHISTWGMYKDAPHEGFTWPKYFRSTVVGTTLGIVAHYFTGWDLSEPAARFVFFGLIYCLERAATEFWKYFIREEDQSKYFIPMQFGIMGKPMKNPWKRIPIGILVALCCVGVFFAIRALEQRFASRVPSWLVALTIGSLFGWISAFGGAWKDAPVEGFETFKFFRSPGVAIAWAVTEHLHDQVGCRTMFATHYHELMQLPEALQHARNLNVAVRESGDSVVFLHRLEAGGTDRSYGIHVAQLAGLPKAVVRRAKEVLKTLEGEHRMVPGTPPDDNDPSQLALFGEARPHPVVEALKELDLDRLTPLEALNRLAELKRQSSGS